jgi:hypothetical protein
MPVQAGEIPQAPEPSHGTEWGGRIVGDVPKITAEPAEKAGDIVTANVIDVQSVEVPNSASTQADIAPVDEFVKFAAHAEAAKPGKEKFN